MDITKELLDWAANLPPWQQDALRRLVSVDVLDASHEEEVTHILKASKGIVLPLPPPTPVPIQVSHLPVKPSSAAKKLKGIHNIKSVNLLVGKEIEFSENGLTVVYGENGSGKSGYVRILRGSCRWRLSSTGNPRPPILSNIHKPASGPASADIKISESGTDSTLSWIDKPGPPSIPEISVFDSQAAALYVDDSSHIAFLPFNLDLPYKLNTLCLSIRSKLEKELQAVENLTTTPLPYDAATKAGQFIASLSFKTTASDISQHTAWSKENSDRLSELSKLLDEPARQVADQRALSEWCILVSATLKAPESVLALQNLINLKSILQEAKNSRQASDLAASGAFSGEPLKGVGGEIWRRLYAAAREYSITQAYPGENFPVTGDDARCVLCQQELSNEAAKRFSRFEGYIAGALAKAAEAAEQTSIQAISDLTRLEESVNSLDLDVAQYDQLDQRFENLGTRTKSWAKVIKSNFTRLLQTLPTIEPEEISVSPSSVLAEIEAASQMLIKQAENILSSMTPENRHKLEEEKSELTALHAASAMHMQINDRVALLKHNYQLRQCIDATATTAITRRAGELTEKHLTPEIEKLINEEFKAFDVSHLKPKITRKSDKTSAQYKIEIKPGLRKLSEILSEGEHRAVALASFIAEARAISDHTTLVIDDPVSSLDFERAHKVAERLAEIAKNRQVIVFTHSLVFYQHVFEAAEKFNVDATPVAIFRTGAGTGNIDPAGTPWLGRPVSKRIGIIRNKLNQVQKLADTSPTEYGVEIKGIYGRLRDCWERLIEEKIFSGVVTRFSPVIQTHKLRFVDLPDQVYARVEAAMTRTSALSHDNPPSGFTIPQPPEAWKDIEDIESVIELINTLSEDAVSRRKK